ncbi:hypothetical protein EPA93_40595 [Ktedonosporobacter rubrisoli]|uniref:ABC transporter permease n=1 Tax=Ktedonosporobacter rubrisoli TaxID=2509675 RepID=A0A4P6K1I8_KTERU|nr:ABC-2 family transporter protein [Ktedonosporobacter rubrisoli]QBD81944.1 hypothetical protein EPA93_40595 [Ktedonosporobacter rubrisoli]
MRYLRLVLAFIRISLQEDMAYRTNFFISVLSTLLNLGTGIAGIAVLFGQIKTLHGWNFPATLVLLGVYLLVGAVRRLVIGPSFDALAGLEGELWLGRFDFTLLRPVNTQFLISLRHWQLFSVVDILLGLGTLITGCILLGERVTLTNLLAFLVTLIVGLLILYALLLLLTGLLFWSPGFLFTWIFDALFQIARYPLDFYPDWVRTILTWIVPIGIITTVPAQALTGALSPPLFVGGLLLAGVLLAVASLVFWHGLRRYASASS